MIVLSRAFSVKHFAPIFARSVRILLQLLQEIPPFFRYSFYNDFLQTDRGVFMTALSPRRTFSGTALKTIACITMLVDHIGAS